VACNKRCPVGAQPKNGFGHFLDATEATDGMQSCKIILLHIHAVCEPIDHLGVDRRRIFTMPILTIGCSGDN
jgi:hypothetical protein